MSVHIAHSVDSRSAHIIQGGISHEVDYFWTTSVLKDDVGAQSNAVQEECFTGPALIVNPAEHVMHGRLIGTDVESLGALPCCPAGDSGIATHA